MKLTCNCCADTFVGSDSTIVFCGKCAQLLDAQVELLEACRAVDGLVSSTYGEMLDTPRRERWHIACRRVIDTAKKVEGHL